MAEAVLLGRTLFLLSQRVALNARFLPLSLWVVFSMALGLMCCCFLTARDRASCSSSLCSSAASEARDLRLNLRQIFFSLSSPDFFVSCLRSHPRGILATGRALGSSSAASVSSHVWLKDARGTRLRGEGTMARGRPVMMSRNVKCYIVTIIRGERMSCAGRERWVVRVGPLVGSGDHNKHAGRRTSPVSALSAARTF
jgi:hypothetical protein